MRKSTGFLPALPSTSSHFRAAQMTAVFSLASAFPQTTVIFWAPCQAYTLKDITNTALGPRPGNLSRYLPSGAKLQPTYHPLCPRSHPKRAVRSQESFWKRWQPAWGWGWGETCNSPGHLKPAFDPNRCQGPSKDGDCRCIKLTHSNGMWL